MEISSVPIEDLRASYKDFRLVPVSTYYGHPLHNPSGVGECVKYNFSHEQAISDILKKYKLPESIATKEINTIHIVISVIGENGRIIEHDMNKMSFQLISASKSEKIEGMEFQLFCFKKNGQP